MEAQQIAPEHISETLISESVLDRVISEHHTSLEDEHKQFEYALRIGAAANDARAGLAENEAQAAMKIMMGRELGVSAVVALSSIHIIKNRASQSGALIAALCKRAGFSWSFVEHNHNGCTLAFFKHGQPLMERWQDIKTGDWMERQVQVTFSREMADRAQLTAKQGDKKDQPSMYDKYGEDMYFNRCITRFQKRYASEISHGIPMYTPDEVEEIGVSDLVAATQTQSKTDALRQRIAAQQGAKQNQAQTMNEEKAVA